MYVMNQNRCSNKARNKEIMDNTLISDLIFSSRLFNSSSLDIFDFIPESCTKLIANEHIAL